MINYEIFTKKWLQRASNSKRLIDKGDQFIALWIAFNGWLKSNYGEDKTDRNLIQRLQTNSSFKKVFDELKCNELRSSLKILERYTILDMRNVTDVNLGKKYDGTYKSLINILYLIRCNLFHGRKNIDEDKTDEELVHLAYDILYPLFDKYYNRHGVNN